MSAAITLFEDVRRLVDRAVAGDQSAIVEIVDRYRQRVFRLCYRMLGQHEDAEDMSQEAFIRLLRHLNRWDRRRDFEPWLLTIAANRCRTLMARRQRRGRMNSLSDAPLDDSWCQRSAAAHLAEEIDLALQTLRDEHRQAFLLFHQDQLSYAEIAESLGSPIGTVKTWVHRARRELVQRLRLRDVIQGSADEVRAV